MLNSIVSYSPYPILYFIGLMATRILHFQTQWTMVLCVALIGLLGSMLSSLLFISIKKHAESLIYSGTLAAMAGGNVSHSLSFFVLTSLLATAIYFSTIQYFPSLGGRLGTIAFLSTGLSLLVLLGFFYV